MKDIVIIKFNQMTSAFARALKQRRRMIQNWRIETSKKENSESDRRSLFYLFVLVHRAPDRGKFGEFEIFRAR